MALHHGLVEHQHQHTSLLPLSHLLQLVNYGLRHRSCGIQGRGLPRVELRPQFDIFSIVVAFVVRGPEHYFEGARPRLPRWVGPQLEAPGERALDRLPQDVETRRVVSPHAVLDIDLARW